jgi:HK97 family phage portal protein
MGSVGTPREMSRELFTRGLDTNTDEQLWSATYLVSQTNSGLNVSQVTALSSAAVFACVSMLAEDVAKLRPLLYRPKAGGGRDLVTDHWLAQLFRQPNDWQSGFEFREFMMVQLCLRSNAFVVILRERSGRPYKLVPVNSDRVAIWEAPEGQLFYRVTPLGLHERAELINEPFLIPSEDIMHVRGLSLNGLLGSAKIVLAKEAIGLTLGLEQQSARWMAQGTKPSGVLTTEKKLTKEAADRLSADWRANNSGPQNVGRVAVLEQGLKFQQMAFTALDLEHIKQRQFQLEECARLFRIPAYKLGIAQSKGASGSIEQQATEYVNDTLTGYTSRFHEKYDLAFDIQGEGLELAFDYSILTRADQSTRYTNYSKAIAGGYLMPNEARVEDGKDPADGGDKLWMPTNVAYAGSQATGTLPSGGGRPEGSENVEK